jgi:hypothetical protein
VPASAVHCRSTENGPRSAQRHFETPQPLVFVSILQLRSELRRSHGDDLPEGSGPVRASRDPDDRIFRSGFGELTPEIG